MELIWLLNERSIVSFRACFLRYASSCSSTGSISHDPYSTSRIGKNSLELI